jgi:hypothetical protein
MEMEHSFFFFCSSSSNEWGVSHILNGKRTKLCVYVTIPQRKIRRWREIQKMISCQIFLLMLLSLFAVVSTMALIDSSD